MDNHENFNTDIDCSDEIAPAKDVSTTYTNPQAESAPHCGVTPAKLAAPNLPDGRLPYA